MRIQRKPNIDPEQDCFRFRFRQPLADGVELVRGVFKDWMREREASWTCDCYLKELSVEPTKNARELEVFFGWFCDHCLPKLELLVKERLPSVTALSVGTDLSPFPPRDQRFIHFSSAVAHFEDGSLVALAAYEICRSLVTTGQYDEFTKATGYVTSFERTGDGSFRFDETIEPIRPQDRGNTPVHNVSFEDAQAYCEWAGVRLPSEAELLAATLVDQRVLTSAQKQEFLFGKSGRFEIDRFPDGLDLLGPEFVVGAAATGRAIIRSGPHYVRVVGWEKRRNRQECPTDVYDLMTGFRICRRSPSI
jgi:hypothetical protein